MLRIVLRAVVLSAIFALGIVASRTLGHGALPSVYEVLEATRCGSSCWYGIRLPVRSITDAEAVLRGDSALISGVGYTEQGLCWSIHTDPPWRGCYDPGREIIRIEPPDTLRLGDLVAQLGAPRVSSFCVEQWYSKGSTTYRTRSVLQFAEFRVLSGQHIETTGARIHPDMEIVYLEYRAPDRLISMPWRGFVRRSLNAGCIR